ncbi:alpha/beta fold hydrolase [Geminicoccus roseus]|uniref:alpha/beta fold hydrolase n=1 Tax=Geminicoccus roseus TaxID=404900 RepID=UPI0004142355|nr:alpha/beta hydrolase [Geminicoccus roseus]
MPMLRTEDGVGLFYRDWGQGKPVVFVASWSLTSDSWGYQMAPMVQEGLRCVAFDRRGHGRSDDPGRGYDYDTLADDLAAVLERLDLWDVTLVGHSMGPGEIVRYLTRHGSARVARIVLLGTITPMIQQADDNPEGIPRPVFEAFRTGELMQDFPQWIEANVRPFLAADASPPMFDWIRQMCLQSSLQALHDCHLTITGADFRAELRKVDVPALLLHGDRDVTSPLALTAEPTAELLPNARLKVYEGAPHGLFLTHAAQVNADLLAFVQEDAATSPPRPTGP